MKCISSKYIFFILFFININKIFSTLLFTYPTSITLSNGNILVIEKNGIYVCDATVENVIKTIHTFIEEDKINDLDRLSYVVIKDKNNYIACLVNFKLYLLTRTGDLIKSTNRLISDDNPRYFSLAPIFVKSNHYYYVIAYFDSSVSLKLIYFKLSLSSNYQNIEITTTKFEKFRGRLGWYEYPYLNKGLSCEYMLDDDSHKYNYLLCYLMINDDGDTLAQDFYEINENKIADYNKYDLSYKKLGNVKQIKSITINDIKRALLAVLIEENNMYKIKLYTYYYEFTSTHLDALNDPSFKCAKTFYGIKTNYIYEKSLLSFSCIGPGAAVQSILVSNSLSIVQTNTQFETCETIYGHSVLYSNYYGKYYVVSDVICDDHQRTYIHLIGDIPKIEEKIEEEEEIVIDEEKFIEEKFEFIEEEKLELMKERELEKEIFEEIIFEKEIEKEKYEEIIEEKIEKEEEYSFIEETEEIMEVTESNLGCPQLEKCSSCNQVSLSMNLCVKCNNEKGYYLLKSNYDTKYIDCVNNITKPYNFYFDKKNKDYEPCFETCFKCSNKGNYEENNCDSCDGITYIPKPEYEDSKNCVPKCKYYYYYTNYGQYKCTDFLYCPDDYNTLIKYKNKCTNDCSKDDTYKYYYNRECLKQCPNNTKDEDNFICKDISIKRCILSENNFFLLEENITDAMVERMTIIYAAEFAYTNTHVSIYKNDIYTITIYKDINCIDDLELNIPEVIFGECEMKVKEKCNITDGLIVAIVDKIIEGANQRKLYSYGLFSPKDGTRLPSDDICSDDKLLILESLSFKLSNSNLDLSTFTSLISQGIDIFNLSNPFYTDVCFQYNSINNENYQNKDIALKDRVLIFFPNITLCENDCEMNGINLTTLKAICECPYSNKNKDILKDNALYQSQVGQFEEFISSTNIYVITCYKNILNLSYFKECTGGLIIFIFLVLEIICTIFYYLKGFPSIKIYIFDIGSKYINFLTPNKSNKSSKHSLKNKARLSTEKNTKNIFTPNENSEIPKEKDNKESSIINNNMILNDHNKNNTKIIVLKPNTKLKRLILRRHLFYIKKSKQINENSKFNMNSNIIPKDKESSNENNTNNIVIKEVELGKEKNKDIIQENDIKIYSKPEISEKGLIIREDLLSKNSFDNSSAYSNSNRDLIPYIQKDEFFSEYLKTEFDDMDFEDLITKDKRKFCEYYSEKLTANQIIINTFCCEEPFKPMSIKILLLLLQIDLYFLINGLFYDEEYASEIFHLEKDSFYDALGRFVGNLVYAALVGIIINYIIEFLFIEETRLKKIFRKQKENLDVLKNEINRIVSDIKRRYIFFIILTFLITIFTWIHISCFNIVYPHLKWEWLLFSVIIILFMQIFSAFICLLDTLLRFLSYKCKSEKIYKISYLLS